MTTLSRYMDRRAPIQVTEYVLGSGNHTFHPKTTRWEAKLVGGGGGAGRAPSSTNNRGASGGAAGATLFAEGVVRPGETTIPYIVGAAGLAAANTASDGTSGGYTRLGSYRAAPGEGGYGTVGGAGQEAMGGLVSSGYVDSNNGFVSNGGTDGVAGGWGGRPSASTNAPGSPGGAPGFPTAAGYATALYQRRAQRGQANGGAAVSGQISGGGGGDSTMGKGGDGGAGGTTPGVGQDGTGFGSGGGAGGTRSNGASGLSGDGAGGYICIWEYQD